ncbi:unnamed protein product [Linum trigynum]|uniref:Phospho-2-dehydro-3-deoxyheptonate aldolase n=1 Tax=Linum trigynum TaxID=586398 RepID=A0AAV2CEX3_9ROSI
MIRAHWDGRPVIPNEESRIPDPRRMIRPHGQSAAILVAATMQRANRWILNFVERSDQGDMHEDLVNYADEAIGFMAAAGVSENTPSWQEQNYVLPMNVCCCHMR